MAVTSSVLLAIVIASGGDDGVPPAGGPPPNDPPIAISWKAPEGCPDEEALKTEVRRIAGPAPSPAQRLEVEATVRRGPGSSWQLTLKTLAGTRQGERTLTATACSELMHASALVMALMINPQANVIVVPTAPPPPPPPVAVEHRDVEPRDVEHRDVEHTFAAGADVVVDSGALPTVAPGIALRFAAARAALSAELRVSRLMSRGTASPSDAQAGGTFDLMDAAVAGCGRARRAHRVSLGVCAGAAVVRVHGSGYGVTDPASATAWWGAGLAEGSVRLRISAHNAVRLAAQAVFSPGRPSFALAGVGRVFEPAPIWLRGTLGWELLF